MISQKRRSSGVYQVNPDADGSGVCLCLGSCFCETDKWARHALFAVNFLVWGGGLCLVIVGLWAISEKAVMTSLDTLATDPAFFVMAIGGIMVLISMCGCVGALRENLCLLKIFSISIILVFISELVIGVLSFVFVDFMQSTLVAYTKRAIHNYMDDIDLRNTINYVQRRFGCCGSSGYNDWEANMYFNCSSPARSACGVPMSCCIDPHNVQCGYDSRNSGALSASTSIHLNGCVPALMTAIKHNLFMIGLVAFVVGFLEIFSILLAHYVMKRIIITRHRYKRQIYLENQLQTSTTN